MDKEKILISIVDPTGVPVEQMHIDWSADQLDSFLSAHRIIVSGGGKMFHLVSDKHRWNPNTEKDG